MVRLLNVRYRVEEIPVRGKENGSVFLGYLEDRRVLRTFSVGSPDIYGVVSAFPEQFRCSLGEVLVEKELREGATS